MYLTDDGGSRPQKRPRLSLDGSSSDPSPDSCFQSLSSLTRHPEFWFDDGNIVLVAQRIVFRIYRGLLASQSTVFADMFASSTSSLEESFDGCPVVYLTDSPHDLTHLLRILLPTDPIHYPAADPDFVRSFDEISAVIRLAHKYHVQSVQDQAIRALQQYYFTSDFDVVLGVPNDRIAVELVHAIGAVNLARLTDTPLMLPAALYRCCYLGGAVFEGWKREDGTVEHLCPDDLKRCFDARVSLGQEQFLLLSRLFDDIPKDKCMERGRCAPRLSDVARSVVRMESMVRKHALWDWSRSMKDLDGLCEGCTQVLLERNRAERKKIWDRLPDIFGLVIDGWVELDGGGPENVE